MIGILQTTLLGLQGPQPELVGSKQAADSGPCLPWPQRAASFPGVFVVSGDRCGLYHCTPTALELLSPLTAPCPGARTPLCPWASLPCSKVISVTSDLPVSAVLELLGRHPRHPPPRAGDVSFTLKLPIFHARAPTPHPRLWADDITTLLFSAAQMTLVRLQLSIVF